MPHQFDSEVLRRNRMSLLLPTSPPPLVGIGKRGEGVVAVAARMAVFDQYPVRIVVDVDPVGLVVAEPAVADHSIPAVPDPDADAAPLNPEIPQLKVLAGTDHAALGTAFRAAG